MKLLKEELDLDDELKDFLRTKTIKDALDSNDFEYIYEQLSQVDDNWGVLTSQFTELMLELGDNPLDYMDYVPKRFLYASGIESFDISSNVISIGFRAFYYCESLTNIDFGDNSALTGIGDEAFYECVDLANITLPNSVTNIGNETFSFCESLTSMDLSKCNGLTSIGEKAFQYCTGLTSIILPSSLTSIGGYAFRNCNGLTSITIPSSVTKIEAGAFAWCKNLKKIKIPKKFSTEQDWCCDMSGDCEIEYY